MFKYFAIVFACLFLAAHVVNTITKTSNSSSVTQERLLRTAENYTTFLTKYGKADQSNLLLFMESLFSPACHKIVNGKLVSRTMSDLCQLMDTARSYVGAWTINILDPIATDSTHNTCIIHYELATQLYETFVVMAYLKCDEQGLIKTIDEVSNKKDN